jgi:hypothetical protein
MRRVRREAGDRCDLFLGFGGLFLLLSYHLRNLWNPRDVGGNGTEPRAPDGHLSSPS